MCIFVLLVRVPWLLFTFYLVGCKTGFVGTCVQFCEDDKLVLFTASYLCFVRFILRVDLFPERNSKQ